MSALRTRPAMHQLAAAVWADLHEQIDALEAVALALDDLAECAPTSPAQRARGTAAGLRTMIEGLREEAERERSRLTRGREIRQTVRLVERVGP